MWLSDLISSQIFDWLSQLSDYKCPISEISGGLLTDQIRGNRNAYDWRAGKIRTHWGGSWRDHDSQMLTRIAARATFVADSEKCSENLQKHLLCPCGATMLPRFAVDRQHRRTQCFRHTVSPFCRGLTLVLDIVHSSPDSSDLRIYVRRVELSLWHSHHGSNSKLWPHEQLGLRIQLADELQTGRRGKTEDAVRGKQLLHLESDKSECRRRSLSTCPQVSGNPVLLQKRYEYSRVTESAGECADNLSGCDRSKNPNCYWFALSPHEAMCWSAVIPTLNSDKFFPTTRLLACAASDLNAGFIFISRSQPRLSWLAADPRRQPLLQALHGEEVLDRRPRCLQGSEFGACQYSHRVSQRYWQPLSQALSTPVAENME